MGEAARLGDPISHTSALAGFVVGAVIGIALIATVAAMTVSCGLAAGLIAGLVAGVGASAILALGEAIGKMFSTPTGTIVSGSPNVFINGRPAAFTVGSVAACAKDVPVQTVATGCATVMINGFHAARVPHARGRRYGGAGIEQHPFLRSFECEGCCCGHAYLFPRPAWLPQNAFLR